MSGTIDDASAELTISTAGHVSSSDDITDVYHTTYVIPAESADLPDETATESDTYTFNRSSSYVTVLDLEETSDVLPPDPNAGYYDDGNYYDGPITQTVSAFSLTYTKTSTAPVHAEDTSAETTTEAGNAADDVSHSTSDTTLDSDTTLSYVTLLAAGAYLTTLDQSIATTFSTANHSHDTSADILPAAVIDPNADWAAPAETTEEETDNSSDSTSSGSTTNTHLHKVYGVSDGTWFVTAFTAQVSGSDTSNSTASTSDTTTQTGNGPADVSTQTSADTDNNATSSYAMTVTLTDGVYTESVEDHSHSTPTHTESTSDHADDTWTQADDGDASTIEETDHNTPTSGSLNTTNSTESNDTLQTWTLVAADWQLTSQHVYTHTYESFTDADWSNSGSIETGNDAPDTDGSSSDDSESGTDTFNTTIDTGASGSTKTIYEQSTRTYSNDSSSSKSSSDSGEFADTDDASLDQKTGSSSGYGYGSDSKTMTEMLTLSAGAWTVATYNSHEVKSDTSHLQEASSETDTDANNIDVTTTTTDAADTKQSTATTDVHLSSGLYARSVHSIESTIDQESDSNDTTNENPIDESDTDQLNQHHVKSKSSNLDENLSECSNDNTTWTTGSDVKTNSETDTDDETSTIDTQPIYAEAPTSWLLDTVAMNGREYVIWKFEHGQQIIGVVEDSDYVRFYRGFAVHTHRRAVIADLNNFIRSEFVEGIQSQNNDRVAHIILEKYFDTSLDFAAILANPQANTRIYGWWGNDTAANALGRQFPQMLSRPGSNLARAITLAAQRVPAEIRDQFLHFVASALVASFGVAVINTVPIIGQAAAATLGAGMIVYAGISSCQDFANFARALYDASVSRNDPELNNAADRIAHFGVAVAMDVGVMAAASLTTARTFLQDSLVARIRAKLNLYPRVIDARTGREIPFPSGIRGVVPRAERVLWGAIERGEFIAEWHRRGYATPRGGWEHYDIHHIQPRELGGTNDFWNLVPVERNTHQNLFNEFWREFVFF